MTKFWAFALSGLMFASCSNNDEIIPNPTEDGEGAMVSLKLLDPVSTRTDAGTVNGTDAENKIESVTVYIFKDGVDGELTKNGEKKLTGPGPHQFIVEETGTDMGFLVAVNQDVTLPANPTYNKVRALISTATEFTAFQKTPATNGNALTAPQAGKFAMAGHTIQTVKAKEPNKTVTTDVAIAVHRLVSKIEPIKEKAGGAKVDIPLSSIQNLFGTGTTAVTFAFDGFTLCNGMNKSDAFYTWNATGNESVTWDTWVSSKGTKANVNSAFDATGYYTKVYAGTSTGDMFFDDASTEIIYAYENQPEDKKGEEDFYYNKKTVYSFIVKGTLTPNDATQQPKVRYWRANLIPDDSHTVRRNCVYKVQIDEINTVGLETPQEAEEVEVPKPGQAEVKVSITVEKWRVKTQNLNI